MTFVFDLHSGDIVRNKGISPAGVFEDTDALVITVIHPHPRYPDLALVVWLMPDNTFSLDALSPQQDVGEQWGRYEDRGPRMFEALHGKSVR